MGFHEVTAYSVITLASLRNGEIYNSDRLLPSVSLLRPRGLILVPRHRRLQFCGCLSDSVNTFLRPDPSHRPTRFNVIHFNPNHHRIDPPPIPCCLPTMPYIDLLHPSDAVSIWYTSSSRLGTVNSLRPDKPIIVMLHPLYLNSSWLWNQMDDPRLNSAYNIIAFDTRTSGKSMSVPSGMYDTWVQAADLALCFQVGLSF